MRAVRALTSLCVVACLLMAGCIGGGEEPHSFNGDPLETNPAHRFTLVDQNGDSWSLSQAEGNITILAFIFARCPDICITVSMNINWVLDHLEPEDRDQVQVVSVTVDPWSDTPEALKEFSEARSADWPHLTSPDAGQHPGEEHTYTDMELIWGAYSVGLSMVETNDEREYIMDHSLPTLILDRDLVKRVVWLGAEWDPVLFQQDLQYLIDEQVEG